jgi:hypothetical protein
VPDQDFSVKPTTCNESIDVKISTDNPLALTGFAPAYIISFEEFYIGAGTQMPERLFL